jgi:hypothetical protein
VMRIGLRWVLPPVANRVRADQREDGCCTYPP